MSKYSDAVAQLAAAQKPAYGAPAYSRFVNRPIGRRIAAASFVVGLTPNGVTGISAVLSVLGVVVLAFAPIAVYTGVIAAFLFALAYAFDSADGQLARLTKTGGPAGEWLDHTVDMGKTVLFHGAILFSLILHTSNVNAGLVALVIGFTTVSVVAFFAWLLVDLLRRANPEPAVAELRPQTHAPLLRSLLRLPSDYGVLCWVLIFWGTPVFWWLYGLLFAANLVIVLAALPVWFRQAQAIKVVT
ncbi:MAG: CDP-alcohol phosphatidyltransferase family protein [Candidatus Nanopelagicales bacterium]